MKEFYLAFSSGDIVTLEKFLADDSVFFEAKNKSEAIGYLTQLLTAGDRPLFDFDFIYRNKGVCYDYIFLLPAIEIRFVLNDPFSDVNPPYKHRSFGDEPCAKTNERVLRFAGKIKDTQIINLIHPRIKLTKENEWYCYN